MWIWGQEKSHASRRFGEVEKLLSLQRKEDRGFKVHGVHLKTEKQPQFFTFTFWLLGEANVNEIRAWPNLFWVEFLFCAQKNPWLRYEMKLIYPIKKTDLEWLSKPLPSTASCPSPAISDPDVHGLQETRVTVLLAGNVLMSAFSITLLWDCDSLSLSVYLHMRMSWSILNAAEREARSYIWKVTREWKVNGFL